MITMVSVGDIVITDVLKTDSFQYITCGNFDCVLTFNCHGIIFEMKQQFIPFEFRATYVPEIKNIERMIVDEILN